MIPSYCWFCKNDILIIYWYTGILSIYTDSADFKCAHCAAFHLTQLKQCNWCVAFATRTWLEAGEFPRLPVKIVVALIPTGAETSMQPGSWSKIVLCRCVLEYDETLQAWRCFLGASRLLGALDTCRVRHCPRGLRVCHISECHIKRYHIIQINHIESVPIFRF